jgi:hypothetical protein
MAAEFEKQAKRYNVRPFFNLTDAAPEIAAKAQASFTRRKGVWRYSGPVGSIPAAIAPPVLFRSYRMRASLKISSDDVTAPIFAYGGQLGGIALYLRAGKPVVAANSLSGVPVEFAAPESLPAGEHVIELSFVRSATGLLEPDEHRVRISANGQTVADGTLHFALPRSFGISETFGVGIDDGSPVLAGAKAGVSFPGVLHDVIFDFSAMREGTPEPHR